MGIIRRLEKQSSLGDWIIRSSWCCGRFSSHFYNEHFLGCKSFEWIFKWDKKFKKNVKLASERRGYSVSWVWCGQFIKNENAAIRKYIMHTNIRLSCVQYSNLWKRRRRSCYVSWLWWHLVRKVWEWTWSDACMCCKWRWRGVWGKCLWPDVSRRRIAEGT